MEIERKYLIKKIPFKLDQFPSRRIRQAAAQARKNAGQLTRRKILEK